VLNPVRAKMVRTVQAWPWSSYCTTAGRASSPPWLAVAAVHRLFHRTKAGAQQRYQQFVREGIDEPSPWTQVRGQIFLGNEEFLADMAALVKKQSLTNVPKAQTQPTRLTGEAVLAQVGQVYGLHPHELLTRTYPAAYHCAAWLLRRIANEPLGRVAKRFGVSPSRISHIQRALETHGLSRQQAQAQKLCKIKQ
jgi:hypothetical protein